MSNNYDEFYRENRISEALHIREMKQADLSNKTGLTKGQITNWVKQRWQPRQKALHLMAKALNVSEMWLAGYDCPMERPTSQRQNDAIVDIAHKLRESDRHFKLVYGLMQLDENQLSLIEGIISQFNLKEV